MCKKKDWATINKKMKDRIKEYSEPIETDAPTYVCENCGIDSTYSPIDIPMVLGICDSCFRPINFDTV